MLAQEIVGNCKGNIDQPFARWAKLCREEYPLMGLYVKFQVEIGEFKSMEWNYLNWKLRRVQIFQFFVKCSCSVVIFHLSENCRDSSI